MTIYRQQLAGIEFALAEPASGEPADTIIFMHGIGGDDTSFAHQLRDLSDQYRVIAWNMPGYRGSQSQSPLSFQVLAEALLALTEALGIERLHVAGQSIGGMVAQEFYHRYPQLVASLTLIATTAVFGGKDDSFKTAFLQARLKPLDDGVSMPELAKKAMPAVTGSAVSPQDLQSAIDAMAGLSEAVYRDVLKCLVTFNRRVEFETIACPVCLIAGGEDTNAPAATMAKMAAKLPHADYHELPAAGHLVNTELPDESSRIIRQFLNKNKML